MKDEGSAKDGVGDNDASLISKTKAFNMIKAELETASSIGADAGSGATVNTVGSANDTQWKFTITEGSVKVDQGLQMGLHVGADADGTNKITFMMNTMSSAGLGIQNLNLVDDTGAKATYAIDAISDAIAKVSAQRSTLGAVQNRLEHTINNLDNIVENTTSAESEIRDTDMAEEMVEYSKNNILAQAGQSMLAQANQSNQGVLSLLG
jgi:flagellin